MISTELKLAQKITPILTRINNLESRISYLSVDKRHEDDNSSWSLVIKTDDDWTISLQMEGLNISYVLQVIDPLGDKCLTPKFPVNALINLTGLEVAKLESVILETINSLP